MFPRLRRTVLGALLGAALAEVVVLAFMGVLLVLALNAEVQTGVTGPVSDTLALWLRLATPALPAGVLVGALATLIQQRRILTLVALAAVSYLAVALAAVAWMSSAATAPERVADLLLGAWASIAYGLIAVPLWIGGVLLLERWTRPA